MKEFWKTIPSIPIYSVSSLGRVKSLTRKLRFLSKKGDEFWRIKQPKIISQQFTNGGYLIVHLYFNNRRKARTVHSLVAESFLGKRPKGLDVCHKNGNRSDNKKSNLKYDARSNNLKAMIPHGTCPYNKSKLNYKKVSEIKKLKGIKTSKFLAKKYKVKEKQIRRVWNGINWGHVK